MLREGFLARKFQALPMVNCYPVMDQFHEMRRMFERFSKLGIEMDEKEAVSYIIHNLPPDWKDYKHALKHMEGEISLHQLGVGLRFEESQRTLKSNDNPKGEASTEKGKRSKSVC